MATSNIELDVLKVLNSVLYGGQKPGALTANSPLLGAVPELDSMAVVSVLGALEEQFGVTFADDELDGSSFASVGSLVQLLKQKLDN